MFDLQRSKQRCKVVQKLILMVLFYFMLERQDDMLYLDLSVIIMLQSLERSHFKYPKCQGGELHDGEALNLVCVDQKCQHRGIICPVCKMESHDDHHILPIKIFLGQIRDLITNNSNTEDLDNLGDYLRNLEKTKKQLHAILKDQINELVSIFRDLQLKIQSTYLSIRKNVLIQSSLTNKLPNLLEELVQESSIDSFSLQREFNKYCELIKYKDSKVKVTDKANLLVLHYQNLPLKLKTLLTESLNEYRSKVKEAIKNLESEEKGQPKVEEIIKAFSFDSQNRNSNVSISADGKEAFLTDSSGEGVVFFEQAFTPGHNKVVVDISTLSCQKMMLGIAKNVNISGTTVLEKSQLEIYMHADGTNPKQQQFPDYESSEEEQLFYFGQGDHVAIQIDFASNRCSFSTANLGKPFVLDFKSDIKNQTSLKLCIGLIDSDCVKILKSQ